MGEIGVGTEVQIVHQFLNLLQDLCEHGDLVLAAAEIANQTLNLLRVLQSLVHLSRKKRERGKERMRKERERERGGGREREGEGRERVGGRKGRRESEEEECNASFSKLFFVNRTFS